MTSRKAVVATAVAVAVLLGVVLAVDFSMSPGGHQSADRPEPTRSVVGSSVSPGPPRHTIGRTDPTRSAAVAAAHCPAANTLLATTHGSIPRFAKPGGQQAGRVPGSWHGGVSTLPVIGQRPGWLHVRLAQRPNESTAWVLSRDVTLTTTPYALVLHLASTHLSLCRSGHEVFSAPIGIGTSRFPTPKGRFFVAFFARPPIPAYGAFVMVTSAHSNVITDWERSGDGMVAIHGPLGSDAQIGTTGARVSHGCIRLHEKDLLRLRQVPVGSPVIIRRS